MTKATYDPLTCMDLAEDALPPPHPGRVLAKLCQTMPLTDIAGKLGISFSTLNRLLIGRNGVSPAMAYRLSLAFNTDIEYWLELQMKHDIWMLVNSKDCPVNVRPVLDAETFVEPEQGSLVFDDDDED